jgi:uncharacterized protein YndB with AHSA1/START domain
MRTVKVDRIIAAPLPDVWEAISEVDRLTDWNSQWTRLELTSETTRGAGTSFRAFTEEGDRFDFRVTGWVENEFVEISPIHEFDERHGITLQSQSFHVAPADEGTATWIEVGARVSTHGPRGWLLGLVFWPGYQKKGLNEALDALQELFEPPEPEAPEEEPAEDSE